MKKTSGHVKLYHPCDWADLKLSPELPLDVIFRDFGTDKVIVQERFWKEFAAEYYSEENWEYLHAALKLFSLWTSLLTEEITVLSGTYVRAISAFQPSSKRKAAFINQSSTL